MAKRLKLAKELLSDEGSIFISIDDNEQANLKLLCDIIFKEENFIKTLVRESGKPFGFKATKTTRPRIHEYILHYCKNKNKIGYKPTYTETTSSS
jgi:type III restriction-modification system methyltransferase